MDVTLQTELWKQYNNPVLYSDYYDSCLIVYMVFQGIDQIMF
jgi:hypothetical protein